MDTAENEIEDSSSYTFQHTGPLIVWISPAEAYARLLIPAHGCLLNIKVSICLISVP